MLRKLIKYEMKSTARLFLPALGAVLLLALINSICLRIFPQNDIFNIPRAALAFIYAFLLIGSMILWIIVTIQRYYKNLMGAEGYLMFTLPVTAGQNILSKAVCSFIWMLGTAFTALLSIFILVLPELNSEEILYALNHANQEIESILGMSLSSLLLILLFFLLIVYTTMIFSVYAAISIGQLSNDHKILCSFAAYIVIYIISQVLSMIIMSVLGTLALNQISNYDNVFQWLFLYLGIESVIQIALGTGYFFVSRHILSRKLNLE